MSHASRAASSSPLRGFGVGLRADVVRFDDDPTAVPSERIGEIGVLATFVGGRCVHGAEGLRAHGPAPV
ncbi:hypothetical protein [Amycolatopsis thermoflava]|uniref:hypothetical protein n=1 Tax=Amycolatopsis thermoflava TaxID=84480 RepID=UPI003EB999AB